MRRALLLCVLLLVGATAGPAILPTAKGTPAALPDLAIVPDDIFFQVDYVTTEGAVVGTPVVTITVYVENYAQDNITSAIVTIYINGTLLGISPVVENYSGQEGLLAAIFSWNTSALPVGVYTVRAQVNDSAGDQHPENNAAETDFTIVPGPPSLKMELEASTVEAAITESSTGVAKINGTLGVSNLYGLLQLINLACFTDVGWPARVSPGTIYASDDGNFSFEVSVTVPQGSNAATVGRLSVFAAPQWPAANLSVSAEATVTVRQYFRIQLSTEKSSLQIAPGDDCTFTVNLYNQGNGNDSFLLELVNKDEQAKDHASATLSCRTAEKLGPMESAKFKINFSSAKDWTLWKTSNNEIKIQVTSMGAPAHQEKIFLTYSLWVHEEGSYPAWYNWTTIDLAVIIMAVAVAAGFWSWRRRRKKTVPAVGK